MSLHFRSFFLFLSGLLLGMFLITQCAFKDDEQGKVKQQPASEEKQAELPKLYLPEMPKEMNFAGERVPLERREVYEAFDRELIYNYNNAGHISYILKLSKRYFPLIEASLKANGIPDDFKFLCVAEGNLQNLVSRVGATGFWQFMKSSAPGYNLEVSGEVDERYEVAKSTEAACKYLKQAYAKFGNWTAAAASYNCGMGGYNSHATYQKTYNYYDLQLPDETNNYLYRILTFKHLMSNAGEFGYMVNSRNGYKPINVRSFTITSSIPDLAQWARNNGSTYKMLKLLNPWLRSRSLSVRGKTYTINLPAE